MTFKLHIPETRDLKPRLTVFGVGGAGGNAVNNMIARSLEGVDFVVANTDAQALELNDAIHKLQLGEELTEGLGAGAKPEVGAAAAEESIERIIDLLKGSHMCFITAGMGGGTGTGAAPIIAQAARELGILTIGVVTKPFSFEGSRRMKQAEEGIAELQKFVDTLIIIPNQNLFLLANEQTTFTEAFGLADDVLYQGVKGVTDLMVRPGLVNLDFADIRSVMDEMGKAMMGTGEAEGEDRAILAAERAIDNPLLDEISLKGARGVLINITGGDDMSLFEVDEASNKIREQVDPEANIIFGATKDPSMNGRIRVSVVATGIDVEQKSAAQESNYARRTKAVAEAPKEVDLFDRAATQTSRMTEPRFEAPVQEVEDIIEAPYVETELEFVEAEVAQENHAPVIPSPTQQEQIIARMQHAAEAKLAQTPKQEAFTQAERGSRFAIDSMFRRISGQSEQPKAVLREEAPRAMQVHSRSEASREPIREVNRERVNPSSGAEPRLNNTERERVDIPAFLRRQAN